MTALTDRIRRILLSPRSEWQTIAEEDTASTDIWVRYVVPLAAIGPIATVIGGFVFGYGPLARMLGMGSGYIVRTALVNYIGSLIATALLAWLIGWLAPRFGGKCEGTDGLKIAAYSATAAWLAGVFGILPFLAPLSIVGIYGLYVLYHGLQIVAGVPRERAVAFEVTLIIVAAVAFMILSLLLPGTLYSV